MAFIELRDVTFSYRGSNVNALNGVSLSVERGEFVVICGASGCGKTTLLRHLKPELAPYGNFYGDISVGGETLGSGNGFTPSVGFVMQDPDNQLVTDKVWHELAFGLENTGTDRGVIRRRVAEMASFFGIQGWYRMDTEKLSGGQKQLLNLASVMVMQPSVLVLDEPTSRLDPIAASEFLSAVLKLNHELGVTVIITEHRLDELLPVCTKLAVMDGGRIIACGNPLETALQLKKINHGMFRSMPVPCRIWSRVASGAPCPLTVAEGKAWLEDFAQTHELYPLVLRPAPHFGSVTAELSDVYFRYGKELPDVLNGLNINFRAGEFTTVIGGNGSGKSTTLSLLAGIKRPYRGKVILHGRAALMPQDPKLLFLHASVRDELFDVTHDVSKIEEVSALCGVSHLLDRHPYDLSGGEQQKAALSKILLADPDIVLCDEPTKGLDNESKIVFAGILKKLQSAGKTIIIVSHDIEFCAMYADKIAMLFDGGIVSSGAPAEFFSQNSFYTTSAAKMSRLVCPKAVTEDDIVAICGGIPEHGEFDGSGMTCHCTHTGDGAKLKTRACSGDGYRLTCMGYKNVAESPPCKENNGASAEKHAITGDGKAPPAHSAHTGSGAVCCGKSAQDGAGYGANVKNGKAICREHKPDAAGYNAHAKAGASKPSPGIEDNGAAGKNAYAKSAAPDETARLKSRRRERLFAVLAVFIPVPLTVYFGLSFFGARRYLLVSMLVILEIFVPFAAAFERRRPRARELVLIASLCAIAIAGRAAFSMLPQFKPVLAVVIIAGAALGAEAGAFVGAMTMLVSNMLFSQGSWTPWQMFAAGAVGALSGMIFYRRVKKSLISLCLFGFFAAVVIYGGIMNPAAVLTSQEIITPAMLLASFATGLPMDIIHAAATVLFLFFLSRPMIGKIERIKIKYGIAFS